MARLTRAESQERTRRLLVEAATRLFLRDGFRATSLETIAEEAGFSRGAVYSNFASKTAIGVVVALTHGYTSVAGLSQVLSLLVAIVLWPAVLLGVDLHLPGITT